jgi:hypothetical protein
MLLLSEPHELGVWFQTKAWCLRDFRLIARYDKDGQRADGSDTDSRRIIKCFLRRVKNIQRCAQRVLKLLTYATAASSAQPALSLARCDENDQQHSMFGGPCKAASVMQSWWPIRSGPAQALPGPVDAQRPPARTKIWQWHSYTRRGGRAPRKSKRRCPTVRVGLGNDGIMIPGRPSAAAGS